MKAGDKVQMGDPLMVMIAMKMEVSDIKKGFNYSENKYLVRI